MRNRASCYPLTVIDHFSRYLLGRHGLPDVGGAGVKPHLRRLFRTCGLHEAIRTDNGAPFASTGIHGLNRLNVWWLQFGITHQRITPGRPQENGAHERLHKTLKERATRPPAANLNLQQRVFNQFRTTYNELRPHEALDDETLASRWAPSPRPYPERIAPPTYPGHFEVRRVRSDWPSMLTATCTLPPGSAESSRSATIVARWPPADTPSDAIRFGSIRNCAAFARMYFSAF
jgi:transposase InsO family protein